jgi:saccharopine dehydrogenase-like NADP-dependent oxidoreductase
MERKILVVGGYGSVGRVISTALGERFPGRVIAAGRSYEKAQALAHETGDKVTPAEIDTSRTDETESLLSDVSVVVMCVETRDTSFVTRCVRQGIHYTDISATYDLLSGIEALDGLAKERGSTAVLSVGLAPGLTNLLASHCVSVLGEVAEVDIFILLGMGEVHGDSSIEWVLDNLNAEYVVRQAGKDKRVQAFGEFKRTVFPGDIGERAAYRFDFSDQHTIIRTLGLDSASTWTCFDSAASTRLFYLIKKLGLFQALRFNPVRRAHVKLLGSMRMGSDLFIAQAVAKAKTNGKTTSYTCAVSGHGEGRVTGLVAAEVAGHLYTSTSPPGVFHIDQVFDRPREFVETFSEGPAGLESWF